MTKKELEEFKDTISKTIVPIAKGMTEEQIRNIISIVEKEYKDLPKGFGNMLYEQIMIMKYNN